jgi:hypothetical protein
MVHIEMLKTIMNRISSTESGSIFECGLQMLPESDFIELFEWVDSEEDHAQEFFAEMLVYLCLRLSFAANRLDMIVAVSNMFAMLYNESLRRRGLLLYATHQNIFIPNVQQPMLTPEGVALNNQL